MNKPEDFVVDPERLGVGPVDLVDRDDGAEAERQRLPGHEPGLRHRPLGGVHQDQHAVHHAQDSRWIKYRVDFTEAEDVVVNGRVGYEGCSGSICRCKHRTT